MQFPILQGLPLTSSSSNDHSGAGDFRGIFEAVARLQQGLTSGADRPAVVATLEELRAATDRLIGALDAPRDPTPPSIASATYPRILVVDDTHDTRHAMAMVVRTFGFDAVTASNGLETLILAHAVMPAAIVTDIAMPVLDGIESARLLKASAATRGIPLIAHTGTPALCDGPQARLFAAVLRKPAAPADLVAALRGLTT